MSDRGRNDGDVKRNSVSGGRPGSGSNASPRNAIKEERVERNERDRTGRTSSNERHHHRSSEYQYSNSSSNMGGPSGGQPNRGMGMGPGGGGGRGPMNMMSSMNVLSGQAFSETDLMSDLPKKKFTGRCRLFVGNLPNDLKEQELKELFAPHGDIAECYLSGKGFAFLRLDTRAHAESAKEAIDGKIIHGRPVRVRFAVHGAALRVKELSPTVSNEMLYHAFSAFGEVERAVHIVDEKGKPTGEGIVEFERKPSANEALHQIREKVFLLTASPKPLVVEMLEPRDEDDGLAERMIQRSAMLQKEREVGPRFPPANSFEYVFGLKWKELYEVERQRRAQLEEELKEAHLARRQQELERLEAAKRERMAQVAARRGEMPTLLGNLTGGPSGPQGMANGPGGMSGGPPPREFFVTGSGGPFNSSGQGGPEGPRGQEMMGRGPPDMQRGGPPQMDNPGRGPPFQQGGPVNQGGGPDPTLVQGVQKLLQIFRADAPRPGGPQQGVPPSFGAPGGPGGFRGPGPMGPGNFGMQSGPPGGFHRGPPMGDFPAEKRIRR
ncbi:WD-repeat protein WDC146, putative [Brugia malayi]|uniref:WD-repeat protein WDC146, putative n=1 Tax=Brugia malayi TaxID=6279 RepID=A0A4E9F8S5_BRUMA|nr:WD-repeat protein WDC146, putative [Brugia malayi]VIO92432.1 WD-repeat protein WDC146, putative [Brugia malayi]